MMGPAGISRTHHAQWKHDLPFRSSQFGSPSKRSRMHWTRPKVVVEVTYLTWTEENLPRQVSYQRQREDKPARQIVRPVVHRTRSAR
jgi:ATP-dependent DNA ligase